MMISFAPLDGCEKRVAGVKVPIGKVPICLGVTSLDSFQGSGHPCFLFSH